MRTLHCSKGNITNITRALFSCLITVSFLFPVIRGNVSSGVFGGGGTMMFRLNIVKVTMLENRIMAAISFLQKKHRIQVLGLAILIFGWI